MPDVLSPPLLALAPLLGTALVAGSLTQLARRLALPDAPRLRPTLALSLAAGIAALTVTALLLGLSRDPGSVSPAWLLAAACITGWSGPDILARLGQLIEKRLGLPATPPLPDPTAGNVPQVPAAPAPGAENGS